MPSRVLQFTVTLEEDGCALVLLAKEDDPGVAHVFASLTGAGIRGMTLEESKLVDHLLTQQSLEALWAEATRVWESWFTVDTLIVVHNVVNPPERKMAEA